MKTRLLSALLLASFGLGAAACGVSTAEVNEDHGPDLGFTEDDVTAVGTTNEYDPGPAPGSGWAELFAQTPNYRAANKAKAAEWLAVDPATGQRKLDVVNAQLVAAGKEPIPEYTLTGDKFRYEMGPVFYRGRLDGTARVLVVGQDAATDEALIHRAFVGGTGQKVQNLLNSVGITQSYLCVNTFIYSIYGQFDPYTEDLATSGPILAHRNQVFEKAYGTGKVKLILSFGNAAHTSVQLWLDAHHGGTVPADVLWVKMLHPGMAGVGFDPANPNAPNPNLKAVMDSFTWGWRKVWSWKATNPAWLPSDPGGRTTQAATFNYYNASIPWRDMPFGTPRMLGRGGTMSERGSGLQVQLHSANGVRYEAPFVQFPFTASKSLSGFSKDAGELAWEPPKVDAQSRFDPGPDPTWAKLLVGTPYQNKVAADAGVATADGGVGLANDFDSPVWYRGRLDGTAKVVVIAQDTSVDSVVSGRTLTGDDGQKIQGMLRRIGAGDSYTALNVYPFLTQGLDAAQLAALQQAPLLTSYRAKIYAKALSPNVKLVITYGEAARLAFQPHAAAFAGTWVQLPHPKDANAWSAWNAALLKLQEQAPALGLSGGDFKPYTASWFANERTQINRRDLPYGAPLWLGTSGDLSQRASKEWLFWNGPKWLAYEPVGG